ncbi:MULTISPECIES: SIR2 family protein [Bacillus cereus group]|uniref:SIR2 family protein n=2 Tax=Bacillus TaxID=1386 RepID=UPI000665766C|nr:SIR2 family protein [Bacillus cereus]
MAFEELLKGNKLPILFIGSGFSKRYLDTPDWERLLINILEFMGKTERDFKTMKLKLKSKPAYRNLSDGEINAKIAGEIEVIFNEYFYESELANQYADWIDEGVNPFRKCISILLSKLNILPEKKGEIENFKELKNKTMAVVTTNYDCLLENIFNLSEDSVFIGQPQLFNPKSLDLGELYKIHGCMTDPENIIITEEDYMIFRNTAKLFSAKLLTLMSENPVVFIGYSINDPNIQQILIDLVSCLSIEQVEKLKNYFYLIEYKEGETELLEREYLFPAKSYKGVETIFPISIVSTDNYMEVYRELSKLTPAMNISTVKQVKRIVKDIVVQATESNVEPADVMTILLEDVNKLSEEHQKFAIAVGHIKDIKESYSYSPMPVQYVFEDILFNNKGFNPSSLLKNTYEKVYFKGKRIMPIYKYSSQLTPEELELCPSVKEYISTHKNIEDYLNNNIIKAIESIPEGSTIANMPEEFKDNYRRKCLWIIKNINRIDLEEIEKFLQSEFQKYDTFNSNQRSDFHRIVSIYDLFKYQPVEIK